MRGMPEGVWPVMLTAFTPEGAIDWRGIDALTDWYIDSGVSGLFAVCQSSEMYHLTDAERLQLAGHVAKRAGGRVPVVAGGTFEGTVVQQAAFVNQMGGTGVDGVVVIVCQMAGQDQPDSVWQANVEQLLHETGDVPLGLYECPGPYHRLLSPELIGWCGATGRFLFTKDTACEMGPIVRKIAAVKDTRLRFFNANVATLLDSLKAGGDGFCGTAANFFPELFVWLCRHFEAEPEAAADLHRFLSVAQRVVAHKYKASAKKYLAMQGMPIEAICRDAEVSFREDDLLTLTHLRELAATYREKLDIRAPVIWGRLFSDYQKGRLRTGPSGGISGRERDG